ncbi:hypothetical protein AB0I77_16545 [Streptomyces sp. NPDC050619]|uniref:hypothetical protein n=1 Tax=Streptomyces sp. NPDC050619 TaxID=3157214 RepID=UPI003421EF4B
MGVPAGLERGMQIIERRIEVSATEHGSQNPLQGFRVALCSCMELCSDLLLVLADGGRPGYRTLGNFVRSVGHRAPSVRAYGQEC